MRKLFQERHVLLLAATATVLALAVFGFQSTRQPKKAEASCFAGTMYIDDISPRYGPAAGGTYDGGSNGTITITGSGLSCASRVVFGAVSVPSTDFTVFDDSEISVAPPPHGSAEGVSVSLGAESPFVVFFEPCLVLQLGCNNAYFYMQDIPFDLSRSGTILPNTAFSFGSPCSLQASAEIHGDMSVVGDIKVSTNAGVPSAIIAEAAVSLAGVNIDLTATAQCEATVNFPVLAIPNGPGFYLHLDAAAQVSDTIGIDISSMTAHAYAEFVNGKHDNWATMDCNSCMTFHLSSNFQIQDIVSFPWLCIGICNIVGEGEVHLAVGPALGLSVGVNSDVGGFFEEGCFSVYGELKVDPIGLSITGSLLGPWSFFSSPDTDDVRALCALGSAKSSGPGGGTAPPSSQPPAPTPPPGGGPSDPSPPVISVSVTPPTNSWRWNRTSVSIHWSVADPDSGVSALGGCQDETISFETLGIVRTCSATNGGGVSSFASTRIIRIDETSPSISGSRTPGPNPRGWNNTDVTVHFACSDIGSVQSGVWSCTGDQVINGEGRNQSRSGTAVDFADNSASATVGGINIDKTPPITTMSHVPSSPNGQRGWYVSDLTFTLDPQDPLLTSGEPGSGIQYTKWQLNGGPWQDYTGPFSIGTEGWNIIRWYSVDNADNVETAHEFRFRLDKTLPGVPTITTGTIDGIVWDQAHLQHGILTNQSTLALAGNATDNLCLWEVRAVDVDNGHTLVSQQPSGANTPDWPPPYPPSSLTYSLNVPLHTGINTIDIVDEDCAGWIRNELRIQLVYVIPGPFDPRSKGFWVTAMGTGPGRYTPTQMRTLLSYINIASDVWGNDTSRNRYGPLTPVKSQLTLQEDMAPNLELENLEKMRGQLLAEWLNMVSGRLPIKTAVNVSRIWWWPIVMNDIGANPVTFAYKVALEIEEWIQPAPASDLVNRISAGLAEGVNSRKFILRTP